MHAALRSSLWLALSATLLVETAAAQQTSNRTMMNRRPAVQGQVNNAAISTVPVYGPGVIDLNRALAARGVRIPRDPATTEIPNAGGAIRWMPPQQIQAFLAANGVTAMNGGTGGLADLAKPYSGPAGTVSLFARCAPVSGRIMFGEMFVSLNKQAKCSLGQPANLELFIVPSEASGGMLLDCAFQSGGATALKAVVLARDPSWSYTLMLGETTQTFPKYATASMPIAIKKEIGSKNPLIVQIFVPDISADNGINLHGCSVTPLA